MRCLRAFMRVGSALVTLGLLSLARAAPAAEIASEAQIKAAFLYNFAKFVEWPPSIESAAAVFRICAIGNDAVGAALEQAVSSKTIREQPVAVLRSEDPAALQGCRILFVGAAAAARFEEVVQAAGSEGVLVVSELDEGLLRGAAINFLLQQQNVRFEINLPAAQRARLKISSHLLKLAVRVL